MEKKFLLKGLDCPHCSALIEKEAGLLEGVSSSSVNLIKQTLTVCAEEAFFEDGVKKIESIVHSHEPDVKVFPLSFADTAHTHIHGTDRDQCHSDCCSCHSSRSRSHQKLEKDETKHELIKLITGGVLFAAAMTVSSFAKLHFALSLSLIVVSYIILGGDVLMRAVKNILRGKVFDENFLMALSTVGAFAIGEYHEAAAVMLFYQIGEFFQELSVKRSRKSISALLDIRPDTALVLRDGKELEVLSESVDIGEIIIVKAGGKIPLDGVVIEGDSSLDTKALTGESIPRDVSVGDSVLSGCINEKGVLKIRVTKHFGESTASKIISLVENASEKKAKTENFITTFARYYTPAVVILAVLLAFVPPIITGDAFSGWIHRALVFLVVSCPCALVISVPLAFFAGIGIASRNGILIKGSNYLEALNKADTVVFDKTGTLTKGEFTVKSIYPQNGFTENDLLYYAAKAECFSNHPIAKSVVKYYGKEIDKSTVSHYTELSGYGVSIVTDSKKVTAGNLKLMESVCANVPQREKHAGTAIYIAIDSVYAGCIEMADQIKSDSKQAVLSLKKAGIRETVMLTGDSEETGKEVCSELGIDRCYARLLPGQKLSKLDEIKNSKQGNGKLIYVGDGINDAPVLAGADIGIAMGALGSDAAIEEADIVLMTDEPSKLVKALEIARKTRKTVLFNIVFALSVKIIILILGAFGIAGMWEAVFGDVGVALIAILNSITLSYRSKK